MPSRIGSEALFRTQLSYMQRIQSQQALVDMQISTGFKSQTFAGVALDSGTIISSSAMMAKIDQYNRNITIGTNRMKLMDASLNSIDKSISTLNGYLAQLSDSTTPPDVPTLAKDLLNQVTDYLNLNDGTRYLFSGSNVSTAPVKTLASGGGVAPTVPAVPGTVVQTTYLGMPLPTVGSPGANYDPATGTFFRPNPDDPSELLETKAGLPPLTTLELTREVGDDPIETGRVIETADGWRGRIVAQTASGAPPETVRVYIEPMTDRPFNPNSPVTMKDLEYNGTQYVETNPPNGTANRTYDTIGGVRNANIDTQSVQVSGALPLGLRPGVTVQVGPLATDRFIITEIEPSSVAGVNPVLKLRPLNGSNYLTATGVARAISLVTGPTAADVTPSGINTGMSGTVERIGRPADYQTNSTAVGGTGYYTNTQAAREALNPQKVQVTDNSTVDYGLSADKSGFARLIYTLNYLQQQTSPLSKEDVTAAAKILEEARTQITSMRAYMGINQKTLTGIQEENTLQKSIANNNFDDLAKQDRTEAIATLTSLQTILEASYQSFARVQDLNLQSFLR